MYLCDCVYCLSAVDVLTHNVGRSVQSMFVGLHCWLLAALLTSYHDNATSKYTATTTRAATLSRVQSSF